MKNSLNKILKSGCGLGTLALCFLYSLFVSLFLLVTLLTPYFNVYGYDEGTPGKWWKDKKIIKTLELNNDQVNRIEGIFSSQKGKMKELVSDLRKKERELADTERNPNSSNDDVLRLSKEVEEIKGNMRRVKMDIHLQIRGILTPQQRGKLREIKAKRGKQFH
ncbi:MAG: Spy/CpxP family protein refolding chaperone [Candidatus Dadabacteria bacterium]|nr:Spy/CpxP family protein refolding chaperone [Candidatus Dadabacteria bacterium]